MVKTGIYTAGYVDAATIAALSTTTFTETFAATNTAEDMALYLATEMAVDKIAAELADTKNVFFIADIDGVPAGFAKVRTSATPVELQGTSALEIERLYVLQRLHGRKVGAALMAHCISFARDHQFNLVWLGVWEHNLKAITFYQRWGFDVFGSHIFMLGTDAQTDLMMKKAVG